MKCIYKNILEIKISKLELNELGFTKNNVAFGTLFYISNGMSDLNNIIKPYDGNISFKHNVLNSSKLLYIGTY
jgi:hypothetical protein